MKYVTNLQLLTFSVIGFILGALTYKWLSFVTETPRMRQRLNALEENKAIGTMEKMYIDAKRYGDKTIDLLIDLNNEKPLNKPAKLTKWTPFHEYVSKYHKCINCPLLHKWEPYFEAYHRHFEKFRDKKVRLLEIGVQSGGSPLMYRWYFGDKLTYIGVDVNPNTKQFESEWASIVIGDQGSKEFWDSFKKSHEKVDILIDDGGHTMHQQKMTFKEMFNFVNHGGVYICEDLATSYVESFGGYKWRESSSSQKKTMIDKSKDLIDYLNGHFIDGNMTKSNISERLSPFEYSQASVIDSIHYYSQVVAVEVALEKKFQPMLYRFGKSIPYSSEPPWDPPRPLTLSMLHDD